MSWGFANEPGPNDISVNAIVGVVETYMTKVLIDSDEQKGRLIARSPRLLRRIGAELMQV